ncbi:hypothetical protein HAX54_001845 [Datura stramonium]|uniref:Uncharacterized protein n=1 Tax=Datura stramonium TaxID=4076 RepID=A0ABS8T301_DATST|nr:hypothetical protein [Datura stramonium]
MASSNEDLPKNSKKCWTRILLKWVFVGGKGGVGKTTSIYIGYPSSQEVDPTGWENDETIGSDGMDDFLSDLANAIPGIDEAMSFVEMLK